MKEYTIETLKNEIKLLEIIFSEFLIPASKEHGEHLSYKISHLEKDLKNFKRIINKMDKNDLGSALSIFQHTFDSYFLIFIDIYLDSFYLKKYLPDDVNEKIEEILSETVNIREELKEKLRERFYKDKWGV